MKTREIEVWIESLADLEANGETLISKKMCPEQEHRYTKCTLVVPEKKVTI